MEENRKATIIIPNFNGMRFLPACIAALRKQTVSCFRILVVDNASSDDSILWMEKNQVPFIREKENLGFAGGVNAGIRAADTPFVILLNNDTEVFPDFVEQLLTAVERSERIFSVSSLMISAGQKNLIDDAGDGMNLFGWAYQRGTGRNLSRCCKKPRPVFSSCGGAAIYRRELFRITGLFDEAHFAYLEDTDIGWRAKLLGYINLYWPYAKVYHAGSATSGSRYNEFKVRLAARNNIWLHYKNQSAAQLFFNAGFLFCGILIKAVFFAKKGYLSAYLSGLREGAAGTGKAERFDFSKTTPERVFSIEWEMIAGTVEYVYNYIFRSL